MLVAMPQSTDATVKPAIAMSSRRRRPMGRRADHDRGWHALGAALAPAVDVIAHAPVEPPEQHADAVLRLGHAAVVAEIVHPGFRVLRYPMSGSRIGCVVETGRRYRNWDSRKPTGRSPELVTRDHHLLARWLVDLDGRNLVGERVAPNSFDLFQLALHVASGTTGRRLVESGRALFQRWNVHPRASDNLALVDSVKPQRIIPAFGDAKYAAFWQSRMAGRCEVLTGTPIAL